MSIAMQEDARSFILRRQKMVLEAPNGEAAAAMLPEIFDRDLIIHLNGEQVGLDWLEEHVRELHQRLEQTSVEVTHAARNGNVLIERHVISGVDATSKAPWVMEVMAAYELTDDDKIKTHYELANMRAGEYSGGW